MGATVTTKPGEVSTDFHRYGVKVEPDAITMYIDGVAMCFLLPDRVPLQGGMRFPPIRDVSPRIGKWVDNREIALDRGDSK